MRYFGGNSPSRPLSKQHVQYQYITSGVGKLARLTIRAITRPDCEGPQIVYSVSLTGEEPYYNSREIKVTIVPIGVGFY